MAETQTMLDREIGRLSFDDFLRKIEERDKRIRDLERRLNEATQDGSLSAMVRSLQSERDGRKEFARKWFDAHMRPATATARDLKPAMGKLGGQETAKELAAAQFIAAGESVPEALLSSLYWKSGRRSLPSI